MLQLLQYYGRYQGFRGNLGGMPGWMKLLLFVAAIPGIVGLLLSALLLCVSLLALLLLTVPVYRLLSWVTGTQGSHVRQAGAHEVADFVEPAEAPSPSSEVPEGISVPQANEPIRPTPRRQIEVKIIE